jgi:hypothetical protein
MTNIFQGPTAGELRAFLQFKRSLGYGYMRAEFTLREFDRFLIQYAAEKRRWKLDRAALAWLSSKPGRKPISVSTDAAVVSARASPAGSKMTMRTKPTRAISVAPRALATVASIASPPGSGTHVNGLPHPRRNRHPH